MFSFSVTNFHCKPRKHIRLTNAKLTLDRIHDVTLDLQAFFKQHFHKQRRAEIGKKSSKYPAAP